MPKDLAVMLTLFAAGLLLLALLQRQDAFTVLREGARRGLETVVDLLPALLVLFPAISLLRTSGLPELLGGLMEPVLGRLGIPAETSLLLLLRPLSGSAALGVGSELIRQYGPDSLVGRTVSVMLGSSETTFYVVSVYFSAAGVKGSRWAVPAALCADLACFLSASWICRLLWGQ